jgi:predicted neuraminidase
MTATALPNPSAGIDALRLTDGRFLLVYNPTAKGRDKLEVAVSPDGKAWRRAVVLEDEPGEYSYPAAIQTRDGSSMSRTHGGGSGSSTSSSIPPAIPKIDGR